MKVTKEKREEIRRDLVAAAVAIVAEKGVGELTTREVAARAGVAPGTAYKYFPDREQLIYAFFELKLDDALGSLDSLVGYPEFEFKEKLQALLESMLAEYLPNREFVRLALRGMIDAPLQGGSAMDSVKRKLTAFVDECLREAIENDELPPSAYSGFIVRAFWDYTIVVVLYWLKDDSDGFARSSEFIDRTLDLYVVLVQSGIVDKAARVGGFLLKNHLHDSLSPIVAFLGNLGGLERNEAEGGK